MTASSLLVGLVARLLNFCDDAVIHHGEDAVDLVDLYLDRLLQVRVALLQDGCLEREDSIGRRRLGVLPPLGGAHVGRELGRNRWRGGLFRRRLGGFLGRLRRRGRDRHGHLFQILLDQQRCVRKPAAGDERAGLLQHLRLQLLVRTVHRLFSQLLEALPEGECFLLKLHLLFHRLVHGRRHVWHWRKRLVRRRREWLVGCRLRGRGRWKIAADGGGLLLLP